MIKIKLEQIINQVFLQKCALCGALSDEAVCKNCEQILPHPKHICQCCAKPLFQHQTTCGDCLKFPPAFDQIKPVFSYQYPLDRLILAAKYGANFSVLKQLGLWMADHFKYENKPDVLMPVPSHLKDLKKRGFNQSVELAKWVSKRLQIPLNIDLCECIKQKRPQAGLSKKERRQNVKGVFAVGKMPASWQHIVIIDDVVTTGATVNEIARLFRTQTTAKISVWACARAGR
jgi:ComF family protein